MVKQQHKLGKNNVHDDCMYMYAMNKSNINNASTISFKVCIYFNFLFTVC